MIVAALCLDAKCSRYPRSRSSAGAGGLGDIAHAAAQCQDLLFAPRARHVQQVLALRGGVSDVTESARALQLLKDAFPSPFADYVAIVVHGPVRWTNRRFQGVLDSLKTATERLRFVHQVVPASELGESSFVSPDKRTTFLIGALTPEFTSDINKSVVPDLRATIRDAMARAPGADGF